MLHILTVPILSQFSAFAFSKYSTSYAECPVLYRVISCAPTASLLPLGNLTLSVYIPGQAALSWLFDFIRSGTHIQSSRLPTSVSMSYYLLLSHPPCVFKCPFRTLICFFGPFQSRLWLLLQQIICFRQLPHFLPEYFIFLSQLF